MTSLCCVALQAGEEMIQPDHADGVHSGAPMSELYHPVDFCIPVGPIFSFVDSQCLVLTFNDFMYNAVYMHMYVIYSRMFHGKLLKICLYIQRLLCFPYVCTCA